MPETTAPKVRRRSSGEGSVYENGDRWRGAVTWTDPAGTRHRRTVTGRSSADARAKFDDLRRDLRLGTLAPAGPAPTLTVGDYHGYRDIERSAEIPHIALEDSLDEPDDRD